MRTDISGRDRGERAASGRGSSDRPVANRAFVRHARHWHQPNIALSAARRVGRSLIGIGDTTRQGLPFAAAGACRAKGNPAHVSGESRMAPDKPRRDNRAPGTRLRRGTGRTYHARLIDNLASTSSGTGFIAQEAGNDSSYNRCFWFSR